MHLLTEVITAEDILALTVVLLLSFIGSVAQDYLAAFTDQRKMSLSRIMFSSIVMAIVVFTFSPLIVDKVGFRGLSLISFICGWVGFEFIQRIRNVDGLFDIIKKVFYVISLFRGAPQPPPPTHIREDIHIQINNDKKSD